MRRLVMLTGARQTGKTTLARHVYPGLRYVNLDAPEEREALGAIRSRAWGRTVGAAILDEVQKAPQTFDRIKFAFDAGDVDFSVLLGSSQILLLKRVRETLAGRVFLYELWPLMVSELVAETGPPSAEPLIGRILKAPRELGRILGDEPPLQLGAEAEAVRAAQDHILAWGGMPALLHLQEAERREWLRAYVRTYLERDLADLARLTDLTAFTRFERLAAGRSGQLLSYSGIARDAGISPATARRYADYLTISYQAVLLPPFHRNLTSRVVKSPKLCWIDVGLVRHLTGQWRDVGGNLFETYAVGECWKWCQTMAPDVQLHFYRTRSGREVDLLAEVDGGVLAMEMKNRSRWVPRDVTPLQALARALGEQWLGGLLVLRDGALEEIDARHRLWAIPAPRLFG